MIRHLVLLGCTTLLGVVANAETIAQFDLGSTSSTGDLAWDGLELSFVDDGDAATSGSQNSDLDFSGFLQGSFADITGNASLSLSGVSAAGSAVTTNIGTVVLPTTGGTFTVFDDSNALLLSGTLTTAFLTGSTTNDAGGFSSVGIVTYTGGSLLSHVIASSGALSISLTNVSSSGQTGMQVQSGSLLPFTADATGQFSGLQVNNATAVPEPASIAFLGLIAIAAIGRRRDQRSRHAGIAPTELTRIALRSVSPGMPTVTGCVQRSMLVLFALFGCHFASQADAGTILKVQFAGTAPEIQLVGGVLSTVNDPGSTGLGDQTVTLDSTGFLSSLQSSLTGASFSLSGVQTIGPVDPLLQTMGMYQQQTSGGSLMIYDAADTLLLGGNLGTGALIGTPTAPNGTFQTTQPISFNTGILVPHLSPNTGSLSISLAAIGGSVPGMMLTGLGGIADFQSSATANVGAQQSQVPEPSTIASFAIIALAGWGAYRGAGRSRRSK